LRHAQGNQTGGDEAAHLLARQNPVAVARGGIAGDVGKQCLDALLQG
jgi:hypothetical protein